MQIFKGNPLLQATNITMKQTKNLTAIGLVLPASWGVCMRLSGSWKNSQEAGRCVHTSQEAGRTQPAAEVFCLFL